MQVHSACIAYSWDWLIECESIVRQVSRRDNVSLRANLTGQWGVPLLYRLVCAAGAQNVCYEPVDRPYAVHNFGKLMYGQVFTYVCMCVSVVVWIWWFDGVSLTQRFLQKHTSVLAMRKRVRERGSELACERASMCECTSERGRESSREQNTNRHTHI